MRTYSELVKLENYLDRFRYLQLNGTVGEDTFGMQRFLNQYFYRTKEWRSFRNDIILRDRGFDMGVEGFPIKGSPIIHHIEPISPEDILNRNFDALMNPENSILVSFRTHNAIHYGSEANLITIEPIVRQPGDTKLW